MPPIPVALQLWSIRELARQDFSGTMARVAALGYHGVELAGYGPNEAASVHSAISAHGLIVAGMHVNIDRLRSEFNRVIEDALRFGTRHIVCPFWPRQHYVSAGACERIGEELGQIGAAVRAFGLQLSFHNHAPELARWDGRTVLDWILGAAAPRDLAMEPDVYWLHAAGVPPEQFLRQYGMRCRLIHLRDHQELGLGPVNFAAVFAALDDIGAAEWLIVEQDNYNHPPLESVRLCLEQLRAWGRA